MNQRNTKGSSRWQKLWKKLFPVKDKTLCEGVTKVRRKILLLS